MLYQNYEMSIDPFTLLLFVDFFRNQLFRKKSGIPSSGVHTISADDKAPPSKIRIIALQFNP